MAIADSETAAVAPVPYHTPVRVSIVAVGAETPHGQQVRGLLSKFGLEGCRSIDLSEDFELTGEQQIACLGSDGKATIVQQTIHRP